MTLGQPAYLSSLQGNIRARPIPWDGARRAGDLTEEQSALIDLVKTPSPDRKQRVEADIDGFRDLFAGGHGKPSVLETARQNTKVLQYMLVLLADLVTAVPTLAQSLSTKSTDPYQQLLPLIVTPWTNSEDTTPLLAATAASALMAAARDESPAAAAALPTLFTFFSGLAKNTDANMQDIAVQQYTAFLFCHNARVAFWNQRTETIAPLVNILRIAGGIGGGDDDSTASLWRNGSTNMRNTGSFEGPLGGGVGLQLLYHVLLVMWQMSFEAKAIGNQLNDEYDIVILYTQLLRLSPKEKTTRLILSTLRNLLSKNPTSLLLIAGLASLGGVLENLSARHLVDTDLLEDLQELRTMLAEHAETKTTFDEYAAEVGSGHLRPSPPHRNQIFWAENARRILDHENGKIPRKLAEIMSQPWDNDKNVLAIACNDIGYLVREVPERRHQLDRLGLKARIMALMTDEDENVRWESLRALGGWLQYSFDSK